MPCCTAGRKRGETAHEEVQARQRYEVLGNSLTSQLSCPVKRKHVVTPQIAAQTKSFKYPNMAWFLQTEFARDPTWVILSRDPGLPPRVVQRFFSFHA